MKATGIIYFSSTELSDSSIQIKISIYSSKSYWKRKPGSSIKIYE